MNERHRHADVLIAIAEGREVQCRGNAFGWTEDAAWVNPPGGTINPLAHPQMDWRVKPTPRKPRRIWVNEYEAGFQGICANNSRALADETASTNRIACVEFIEVVPDGEPT